MSGYQGFLLLVLVMWPVAIVGLLFLMSKLETYVERSGAETPEEAGLEPVQGDSSEREVKIVFGEKVIGDEEPQAGSAGRENERQIGTR